MNLVVVTTLIDILCLLALGVWKLWLFMGFFILALVFCISSTVHIYYVCICVSCFSCDISYFCTRPGNGICLLVVGHSELKTCAIIELPWHSTNITHGTKSMTAQNKHAPTHTPDPIVSVLAAVWWWTQRLNQYLHQKKKTEYIISYCLCETRDRVMGGKNTLQT